MAELMKGKVWGDRKHLVEYPVIAEIKYDEIRVHVKYVNTFGLDAYVEFLSYAGNELHNLEAFAPTFCAFFKRSGLTELDCGVEVNGNFNDSYRWTRSSTGIPKEKLDKKTGKVAPALYIEQVRWILFDAPGYKGMPYRDRRVRLDDVVNSLHYHGELPISRPLFKVCYEEAHVDKFFEEMRERGFEGVMVKTLDHTYEPGKRIDGWLKMKPSDTADGKITAINEAISEDGTPLGRAGSVTLLLEDNSVASPHGIPHELGRDMWEHPGYYLGQWVEFDYMERDRKGGYRHPTFKRLREAK